MLALQSKPLHILFFFPLWKCEENHSNLAWMFRRVDQVSRHEDKREEKEGFDRKLGNGEESRILREKSK